MLNFFKKAKKTIGDFLYKNRYGTIMVLLGITIAFWDLFTKIITEGKNISLIQNFISIVSTQNTGGAWSIFSNSTLFLIIISFVFIVGIIIFNFFLKHKSYFYAISMGLLLSGSICNLYDRLAYGYVRDFIKLDFINFPIFNLADIAITVGTVMLVIFLIFKMPKIEKEYKKKKQAQLQLTARKILYLNPAYNPDEMDEETYQKFVKEIEALGILDSEEYANINWDEALLDLEAENLKNSNKHNDSDIIQEKDIEIVDQNNQIIDEESIDEQYNTFFEEITEDLNIEAEFKESQKQEEQKAEKYSKEQEKQQSSQNVDSKTDDLLEETRKLLQKIKERRKNQ